MEIPLLKEIIIIFGLAIVVLFVCHRIRVPAVVGFLLTGIVAGPYGMGLIKAVHEVEMFAEVGVVLLLFTIGMEFSIKRLVQIKVSVLLGGSFQVILTFLATLFIYRHFCQTFGEAVFIGFLVTLSSTAIVLKLYQERAEVNSPHGHTTLGILIFQDIIVVPMILLTPLLAGATGSLSESLLILFAKGIGIIVFVIASAKWLVPKILYQIARTRNHELFLLSVVVMCFGVAWLTSWAGLSLALGAFMAGLIISESEYSHEALGNILPFRDVFTCFFFISIGMLLDVGFFFQEPVLIVLAVLCVFLLKSFIAGFVTVCLGYPLRTGILVGFSLGQIGEFSFILSRAGVEHGLLAGNIYQVFLAVSILTMAATPFIMTLAPRLADLFLRMPFPEKLISGLAPVNKMEVEERKDHLIVIGFGVTGRHLAQAARVMGISYAIVEMNPETVRAEKSKGEPIYYGDATQRLILEHVNIKDARIVVVAINDATATRRITEVVKRINPKVHLIVRSRFVQEMRPLHGLGADEVIPEELETSVEIFTRVLAKYLIPKDEIDEMVAVVRSDGYKMLRNASRETASIYNLKIQLPDVEITPLRIGEKSSFVGKSLSKINLRKRYDLNVLAIRRDSKIISNPDGDVKLYANDVLFVLGVPEKISGIAEVINP